MADRRKKTITALLSILSNTMAVISVLSDILISLIVQQQQQQDMLFSQAVIKENVFIMKAKRKWTARRRIRSCWKKPGRTEQWWQNLWEERLPEEEWHANLRMGRSDFMKLVEELRPHIQPDLSSPNYTALSAEKKVAVTLYYLKDTGSIRMTANLFGIAKSTVSNTVCQVCEAISTKLGPNYIKLPTDLEGNERVDCSI